MIENAIADFATRLGIPTFALNEQGLAALQLEDNSIFTLEKTEDELLIYLTFPVPSYNDELAEHVLELSHYKYNYPFPLFTGFYNENAMFLTRFVHANITAAVIENSFMFLVEQSNKLKG